MFYILILEVVVWVNMYVKLHQLEHSRVVHAMAVCAMPQFFKCLQRKRGPISVTWCMQLVGKAKVDFCVMDPWAP